MKQFPYKTVFLTACAFFWIFIFLACGWAAAPGNGNTKKIGGACSYKSYVGRATIVSLSETTETNGSQGRRFDVRFSFEPLETIEEGIVKLDGRTFSLYDESFRHPDETFVKTHDLRVGKVLPGSVLVIKKGTCTPVLFDFPALKSKK